MIAISVTAHENPRVIMELASNIKYCYNNNAFLIVHVSADYKEAFYRHAAATGVGLFKDNVFWNDMEINTKWGNTLPMNVANYFYAKLHLKRDFTHFQIISSSNLLIKRDLDKHVASYDCVMRNAVPAKGGWLWEKQLLQDARYTMFRHKLGFEEPLCARVDGLAVRDEIFGEFVRNLMHYYSISDMQNLDPIYPQEETVLPTFLSKFTRFGYSIGDALAKTLEPNEGLLTVDHVQKLMDENNTAYLKRIAPQEDNEVRQFILQKMSYGR